MSPYHLYLLSHFLSVSRFLGKSSLSDGICVFIVERTEQTDNVSEIRLFSFTICSTKRTFLDFFCWLFSICREAGCLSDMLIVTIPEE